MCVLILEFKIMDNEQKYIDLISKDLCNELTFEEKTDLENWLKSSDVNQKLYNDYKEVWKISDEIPREILEINVDDEFEKFKTNNVAKKKVISMKQTLYYASFAAAAVLIFFVLKFIFTPQIFNYQSNETFVQVTLPDSSVVLLSPNSNLTYINKRYKSQRLTELNGDAFFRVKHDAEHPFIVQTADFQVTVKGTQFLVSESQKSVFVRSGKVLVENQQNFVTLGHNEKAVLNDKTIVKSNIQQDVTLEKYFNEIKLSGKSLEQVAALLETIYDTKITFADNSLKSLKISFSITQNQSLDSVLQVIDLTLDIKITKNQNGYYIEKR